VPSRGGPFPRISRSARTDRKDFENAVQLLQERDHAAAIEGFEALTAAKPRLAAAHINLGMAYGSAEQWEQAEASMQRALELSPRHPVAHNELGIIQRHQGKFEEARQSYERALDEAPGFHYARRNLAILCDLFLKDLPCALEHYERYAELAPEDEQVGIWVADLRTRAGELPVDGP
jgi:Flp pilus assembly protein TadD